MEEDEEGKKALCFVAVKLRRGENTRLGSLLSLAFTSACKPRDLLL